MKGLKPSQGSHIDFLYINAGHPNPYMRVAPAELLTLGWKGYDRWKYVELALDAAETLLTPFGYNKRRLRELMRGSPIQPKLSSYI